MYRPTYKIQNTKQFLQERKFKTEEEEIHTIKGGLIWGYFITLILILFCWEEEEEEEVSQVSPWITIIEFDPPHTYSPPS